MHVSYTSAEAELAKATLQLINFNNRLRIKKLANLYFCTSFLTCHKCWWIWWTDGL